MKFQIINQTKTDVEFEIEIGSQEFNKYFDQAILAMGKDLEIKGFRKGKAPKEVTEEHFGLEKVLMEAGDLAINDNYRKAVVENNIEAVLNPEIKIKKLAKGNDFIFAAKTAILPEIILPDYRKIASKVKKNEVSIDEKELEGALKWLQKSRSKLTIKNGPAEKGDFVEIDYSISAPENKKVDRKDAFILGEGHFIPGFEDQLLGMKAGDNKENIALDVPKDHALAKLGSKVTLKVKVNAVQNIELPEITDELAKGLGKFDNLEALKKNIKEGVTLEKKQVESQRVRDEIIQEISKDLKFTVPDALINQEKTQMLENLKKQIDQSMKISFEDYSKQIKKTEEEILTSFSEQAEKRIRSFLILREIGKKENIDIAEPEKIFQLLEELTQKS